MAINPTIRTYNDIASEFATRNWEVRLDEPMKRFTACLPPKATILDLGCGPGRDIAHFRKMGYQTYGADLSVGMLAEAKQRIGNDRLLNCDMSHLSIGNERFDGVWLCAALLHLSKAQAVIALKEIGRIIKKRGVLFVAVQSGKGERWAEHFGRRYFSYYQAEELEAMVREAGYGVRARWERQSGKKGWIHLIGER